MRGFLRIVGFAALALLLLVALVLGGFRVAASMREKHEPEVAVGGASNWVNAGGLPLQFREWGPVDGPVLLLVHGTSAWSETWRDIAVPLGEAGFRVLALDLPPFGYSHRPADGDYSRVAQAGIVRAFARALSLDDYVLVGHSFGGGATVEAALAEQPSLRGLVLLDVALGLDGGWLVLPVGPILSIPGVATAVASATFANPLLIPWGLRDFVADDAIVTDARVALYSRPLNVRGTSAAVGAWMTTGLLGDHSQSLTGTRDGLAEIRLPTLVIWGREDTVTPLAQGEDIALTLPNAELVVLDGVNHIPHIEKPAEVVREMLRFLQTLPTPGIGSGGLRGGR
jgi:pimeloyl-ACP methyl ester carboxylesterase